MAEQTLFIKTYAEVFFELFKLHKIAVEIAQLHVNRVEP